MTPRRLNPSSYLKQRQLQATRCPPPDLSPWHALQDWLELYGEKRVVIPYGETLGELTSPAAVRIRRDFPKLLTLIQTHAILHQRNRERDDEGRVIATLDDYAAVYQLVDDVLSDGVQTTVSDTERETVEAVRASQAETSEPVTYSQLEELLGLDKSSISRRVKVAIEHGYLTNLETHSGKHARIVVNNPLPEDRPVIPVPVELAQVHNTKLRTDAHVEGEGGATTPPKSLQRCNTHLERGARSSVVDTSQWPRA